MIKNIIRKGTSSPVIEKMSKCNNGKRAGSGETLLALSTGKKFILIKDGIEYQTKTLKELQSEFKGFFIKTKTWFKFCGLSKKESIHEVW